MDEQAFVTLFRVHLQSVSKYLSRRVESKHVEDLASEIFEIAWRKRAACPAGFELAWLYRISGFVVANHRRRAENRVIHLAILEGDKTAPSAEDLVLDGSDLARAYQSLNSADRQIISLLAFDGLNVSEIAVVLGISANTASQKLKRARARLSKELTRFESDKH